MDVGRRVGVDYYITLQIVDCTELQTSSKVNCRDVMRGNVRVRSIN